MDGDEFIQNHYYDIGVAVGTEKGLIVPVLRDCDKKSFAQLEKDIAGYAAKARDGKIGIDDLTGGVFTISNGGTYGSLLSTPILNPPQSGILGMHNIVQRPVAVNGEVVIRPMMYLALELRSPRGGRQGSRHGAGADQGLRGGPQPDAAGSVRGGAMRDAAGAVAGTFGALRRRCAPLQGCAIRFEKWDEGRSDVGTKPRAVFICSARYMSWK